MILKRYVVLVQYTLYYLSLFFLIINGISSAIVYFRRYLMKSNTGVTKINVSTEKKKKNIKRNFIKFNSIEYINEDTSKLILKIVQLLF